MKKIFYILASAIVALGAVACENEGMENIAPEVNGDTVSFVANIDNTKTDLEGLQTVWTAGDAITVVWNEKEYTFKNTAEKLNVFSCTEEGLSAIKGQHVEAYYNKEGVDSSAGTAGAQLYAEGSFGELSFQIQSAFLKFTTTGIVTLEGEGLFSTGDTFTTTDVEGGEYYVAINPTNGAITFTASSYGAELKSTSLDFDAKKLYDLGTLTPYNLYIEDNSGYKKMCVYGWNITSEDPILGAGWPGVEATALAAPISYNEKTYNKVVPLSDKVVATEQYGFVLNNGDMGSQYGDYKPTTASNLFYTANPKNLIYIKASGLASGSWKNNLHCYMWNADDDKVGNNWGWPGVKVDTSKTYKIYNNNEEYYCYDVGENKTFNRLIINNNSEQTGDITIPNIGKGNGVEVQAKNTVYIWEL